MFLLFVFSYSFGLLWRGGFYPERFIFEFEKFNSSYSISFNYEFEYNFKNKEIRDLPRIEFEILPFFNKHTKGFFLYITDSSTFYITRNLKYIYFSGFISSGVFYNIPFKFKENKFNFRIKFPYFLKYSYTLLKHDKGLELYKALVSSLDLKIGTGTVCFILSLLL